MHSIFYQSTTFWHTSGNVKVLGKYVLKELIGKGAMGSVWLSSHPRLKLPVAVKILDQKLAEESIEYVQRFIEEGRTAAIINHPNIVRIYDADHAQGQHFLVMEYIDGSDIRQRANQQGGSLSVQEVLELAIKMSEALKEAQSAGIVHRDIKPENIMEANDGKLKLADLGIAKRASAAQEDEAYAIGTPHYISPEQALDARQADHRSDIYSLGATMYHLLTGQVPFDDTCPKATMMKHLQEPLQHPQDVKEDLPDNICAVVCKMMEKISDDRYQSYDVLLDDLNKIKYRNAAVHSLAASGTSGLIPKKIKKIPKKKHLSRNNINIDRNSLQPKNLSRKHQKKSLSKIQKNVALSMCLAGPVLAGILYYFLIYPSAKANKEELQELALKAQAKEAKKPLSKINKEESTKKEGLYPQTPGTSDEPIEGRWAWSSKKDFFVFQHNRIIFNNKKINIGFWRKTKDDKYYIEYNNYIGHRIVCTGSLKENILTVVQLGTDKKSNRHRLFEDTDNIKVPRTPHLSNAVKPAKIFESLQEELMNKVWKDKSGNIVKFNMDRHLSSANSPLHYWVWKVSGKHIFITKTPKSGGWKCILKGNMIEDSTTHQVILTMNGLLSGLKQTRTIKTETSNLFKDWPQELIVSRDNKGRASGIYKIDTKNLFNDLPVYVSSNGCYIYRRKLNWAKSRLGWVLERSAPIKGKWKGMDWINDATYPWEKGWKHGWRVNKNVSNDKAIIIQNDKLDKATSAKLLICGDNMFIVWLNGVQVGKGGGWKLFSFSVKINNGDILALQGTDVENGNLSITVCCVVNAISCPFKDFFGVL
jgi:serine/threonine protein kinase